MCHIPDPSQEADEERNREQWGCGVSLPVLGNEMTYRVVVAQNGIHAEQSAGGRGALHSFPIKSCANKNILHHLYDKYKHR